MICRAGGLTQKFVMHMLQTMVKPALHLLYSSTIEESEPVNAEQDGSFEITYSSTIEESEPYTHHPCQGPTLCIHRP